MLHASVRNASRRSRTCTPTTPPSTPSSTTSTSARRMNGDLERLDEEARTRSSASARATVAAARRAASAVRRRSRAGASAVSASPIGPKATWWRLSRQAVVAGQVGDREVVGATSPRRRRRPRSRASTSSSDVGGDGVDAVERLVEQQQPRLLGDGPGEQHPLALAAGQHAEPVAGPVGEPDPVERRRRPRRGRPGRAGAASRSARYRPMSTTCSDA